MAEIRHLVGLLDDPILFLSHYILRTKPLYYEGLQKVTEQNAWEEWIMYILEAVETTAAETQNRVNQILDAMEKTQRLVQKDAPKIYSKDLIEVIFKHPYCKIRFIEEAGLAKRQTAAAYLQTLEKLGILRSIKIGVEKYYINTKLTKILSK